MAEAEQGVEQAAPPKNVGKILGLLFAVVNLAVMGGGAYITFASTLGYKPPKISEEELNKELVAFRDSLQTDPVVYTMETLTTNLNGLPRRLIRLEVNVEMLDDEGFEEVISLGGEARDSIVRLLNGKKYQHLETVQGKLELKNEIISRLNASLSRGIVKNIYFSDFVIQ